jgi:phage head maturation protease
VDAIYARTIDGYATVIHEIRFAVENWTAEDAKGWLMKHDYDAIEFEPATNGKAFQISEFEFKTLDVGDPLPIQLSEPKNPDRVIRFRASDDTVDRAGDVVMPSGWMFADFAKNPVVTQFHESNSWPLGQAVALGVVDNALLIDAEFDPPDVDEESDRVFRKIKYGSIRAGSVAFVPVRGSIVTRSTETPEAAAMFVKYPTAQRIYTKNELLEWTICPIPCNPNAVRMSLKKRLESEATKTMSEVDQWLIRRRIDSLAKAVKGD